MWSGCADDLAQPLEIEGEQCAPRRARSAGTAQPLRFLQVHEQELVQAEVRGQADVAGRLVGGDLVEVARQAVLPPQLVLHHLVRAQQRRGRRLRGRSRRRPSVRTSVSIYSCFTRSGSRPGTRRCRGRRRPPRCRAACRWSELGQDHQDVRLPVLKVHDARVVVHGRDVARLVGHPRRLGQPGGDAALEAAGRA